MDRSEKFWDRISGNFARQAIKDEESFANKIETIKKHLKSGDVLLDFACGTGTISIELANSVKEIQAIDISSKMLDIAKERTAQRDINNIKYTKATLFDKGYKRESFDLILAFNILHFMEDTDKLINRVHELLKPSGLFISETPCMGEKKSLVNILMGLLSKTGIIPYIKFIKSSALENAIVSSGFQISETENFDKTPPQLFIVAKKL